MTNRRNDPVALVAAKAGFSPATGYRILQDGRLPSQQQTPRGWRRPDPLAGIFDEVVVPVLEAAPGLRPIVIFEELRRRFPGTIFGSRRTLERRIRDWRAMNGQDREVIFRQVRQAMRSVGYYGLAPLDSARCVIMAQMSASRSGGSAWGVT